jgi:hypothetical protein
MYVGVNSMTHFLDQTFNPRGDFKKLLDRCSKNWRPPFQFPDFDVTRSADRSCQKSSKSFRFREIAAMAFFLVDIEFREKARSFLTSREILFVFFFLVYFKCWNAFL